MKAVKIIATVVVAAVMGAGGLLYVLAQQGYASETVRFKGQTFHLAAEKPPGAKTFFDFDPEGPNYVAVYLGEKTYSPSGAGKYPKRDVPDYFVYKVYYNVAADDAFVRGGVYSAAEAMKQKWNKREDGYLRDDEVKADYYTFAARENDDGDITRVEIQGEYSNNKDFLVRGERCGASRANAFVCVQIRYWTRNDQHADLKEWAEKWAETKGVEGFYQELEEHSLVYNEEMMADMKTAFERIS